MDFITDTSKKTFIKISENYSVPSYVADHALITEKEAANLTTSSFADELRKELPINNKANTWMSHAYFQENQGNYKSAEATVIKRTLDAAAYAYGIREDVNALTLQVKEAHTQEIPCAFIDTVGVHHYPIGSATDVTKAAEYFIADKNKLNASNRKTVANFIFKEATARHMRVTDSVYKEAGYAIPSRELIVAALQKRAELASEQETKDTLAELCKLAEGMALDTTTTNELEGVLSVIDTTSGMDRHYGHRLATPAESIYGMSMKQAQAIFDDSLAINTDVVSKQALADLDSAAYKDIFDETLYGEVVSETGALDLEKLAEIVPTLPLPDKLMLEESIANVLG